MALAPDVGGFSPVGLFKQSVPLEAPFSKGIEMGRRKSEG